MLSANETASVKLIVNEPCDPTVLCLSFHSGYEFSSCLALNFVLSLLSILVTGCDSIKGSDYKQKRAENKAFCGEGMFSSLGIMKYTIFLLLLSYLLGFLLVLFGKNASSCCYFINCRLYVL